MTNDGLESQLRELFERQADAIPAHTRAWDDPPMVTVTELRPKRPHRSGFAAVVAVAAAVVLVIGIVAIAPGHSGVAVGGQPGVAVPVHFSTPQVSFAAGALAIDANGRRFTAGGSTVDVQGDPGTPNQYTTLELTWNERGVEMRLYIYFTSDGHDWWASEVRTYNGNSPGDWIFYSGTYFRTALGAAFVGDVDLRATDGNGRLQLTNLRLQAFVPPAACKHATAKYAINPSYDHVDLVPGADGFGLGTTALLDTTTCVPVTDPHAYAFDWRVADPAVVNLETYDQIGKNAFHASLIGVDPATAVDLHRSGVGSTTVRITARLRSTGKVVATAEIPVSVG